MTDTNPRPPVLLIGTLDTKGPEVSYLRDRLRAAGVAVLVADVGAIGTPTVEADIPRDRVFAAAGSSLAAVVAAADRGKAVALAAEGVAKLAVDLHRDGKIAGILGLGGSAGTTIATAAMRALPVGVPKLVISTLASGDVRPYVGTRDVTTMYSVVDLAGLNRISRRVLDNAAAAMAGMVSFKFQASSEAEDRSVIAATMFGVTTPCVEAARKIVEAAGYEVLVFHATGIGGRTMEGLIRDGLVAGVLDLTTTELADELAGGVMSAGPDRLTAAALAGIPQVISVGAVDMVNFGTPESVPEKYAKRKFYRHNPTVTLMRTTPEENDRLGQEIANRACAARGPTAVMVPLRGFSAIDAEGKPFWWPEADAALVQSLRNWTYGIDHEEIDAHINDPAFAAAAAQKLLAMLR